MSFIDTNGNANNANGEGSINEAGWRWILKIFSLLVTVASCIIAKILRQ
jgi:hypothetical protein